MRSVAARDALPMFTCREARGRRDAVGYRRSAQVKEG
jgi:hypothetical protein